MASQDVETYEVIEGEIVEDDDGERMDNEVVFESTTGHGHHEYAELGVEQGEMFADLYVEGMDSADGDGEQVVAHLKLTADQLRALIDAAERALETVEANS